MLDKKTILEAEKNIRRYLAEGKLKKVAIFNNNILNTYKKNYLESLKVADELLKNNTSSLWVIVCSYYSMFYSTNAVLYKLGYKTGTEMVHKITLDSLIVFIRNKLRNELIDYFKEAKENALELAEFKSNKLIEDFSSELDKRGRYQYDMSEEIKRARAETSLKRAKEFIFEMEKLLVA